MKILALLLLITSSAFADYLEPSVSGNTYAVMVNGVMTTKHTVIGAAISNAIIQAQKCKCTVLIKSADLKVSARNIVTSSSTASSTPMATLTMGRPTMREDGKILLASEIAGYELRVNDAKVKITPSAANTVQYALQFPVLKTDIVAVATFDTSGQYSEFVQVPVTEI